MKPSKAIMLMGLFGTCVVVVVVALSARRSPSAASAVADPVPPRFTPSPSVSPAPSPRLSSVSRRPAARSDAAPAELAPPAVPPPLTEAALMTKLRDLGGSDPELSLRLAREGNRRFDESVDVPERSWIIIKALMSLRRTDEAMAESRVLLEKHPDTSWAEDVHRHLFVNPPTHPLERGYGQTNELQ